MRKPEIVKPPRPPKVRTRYSIGEWYGRGFETLLPAEIHQQAKKEVAVNGLTGTPCPFQLGPLCNKKGGVCSLRLYRQAGDGPVSGAGPIITTCPQRFLEADTIFRWVGEALLQTTEPLVLSQIGFLDRLRPNSVQIADSEDEEDSGDFIGRIDNVLVHPSRNPIDWCALEIQAVYFSGKSMSNEFTMLAATELPALAYPAQHRRPDWRSSGPKRLLPQLQTKIPTIRTWGKKVAVVIDEAFFGSLVALDRERHLSNAEIAWFIVGYDPAPVGWKLVPREVIFTKLDASVKSLTGGVPLPKERFEAELLAKLRTTYPSHDLGADSPRADH